MTNKENGMGFGQVTDEDLQMFRHYVQLCDGDFERAFLAYKDQYIIPLRNRITDLETNARRNRGDRRSDIDHFIDFIKKLGVNEDMDYQRYLSYYDEYSRTCKKARETPREKFGKSKFYEIRPFAIKRILVDDLPAHFSLNQAKAIIRDNEWYIAPHYIEEALEDRSLFEELPLDDNERETFLKRDLKGDPINDNSPFFVKYQFPRASAD